jgi:5-methylcytosine-specific restriction enzyme subunit McrC
MFNYVALFTRWGYFVEGDANPAFSSGGGLWAIEGTKLERERFVLGYYRRHYPQLGASAAHLDWNASGDKMEYLPIMKSDITLRYKGRTLIIDTKDYQHTMAANGMFNTRTLHSHNLYQIFTYVKNMDAANTGSVSGLLLYAKTDEDIVPDCEYIMGGNRISVKTLDLNTDFRNTAKQLNQIADRMLA